MDETHPLPRSVTLEQALEWRTLYEDEQYTIETLSLEHHRSAPTIRKALWAVDTNMRKPGQKSGTTRHDARAVSQDRGPAIHVHGSTARRTGHRRRSWY